MLIGVAACSGDTATDGAVVSSATAVVTSATPTTAAAPRTSSSTTTVAEAEPVDQVRTLQHDGLERTYRLYVPSSLDADAAVPLVVALHGGLGSGDQFIENAHWREVAEQGGFVLVAPDGLMLGALEIRTWNGGDDYCCGPAQAEGVDDVGFVLAVIEDVATELSIDSDRVFATGHSNGAILSYRLACEAADVFAAIAPYAGSLGVDECDPSRPVSVLHLHGDADLSHPIQGGVGENSVVGVEFNSAFESVDRWVGFNGCSGQPVVAVDQVLDVSNWESCDTPAVVTLAVIIGGSHAWPGGVRVLPEVLGEPSQDIDASSYIWEFFLQHGR